MSLENGFSKIKRNVGIKKCVLVDGNVGDVYLDESKQVLTLRQYLEKMLKELGYEDIIYWDRVEGASGNLDALQIVDKQEVEGDEYSLDEDEPATKPENQGLFKSPSEIMPIVFRNLKDPHRKVAFILNWSEYIFGANGLSEEEKQELTFLGKSLKDRKVTYLDEEVNESTVIMIANKASALPLSFYSGNPEVELVTLQKPDRKERERLIKTIENAFALKLPAGFDTIVDAPDFQTYIDMLDDFTNREIIQLAKLSRKERNMTFDKLFYLFKYGEKDNPWEKLDYQKVKNLKQILSSRVIGQEEAIDKIEKTVIKAYMGLTGIHKSSSRSMPKGVFFFVGPTGVGKTELSKALAQFLFGDEQACIRFDMSEYAQENSDQKLIGAAPGYVGYEEGGQLTNAIKEHPFSVVLFDEIEKACKPNPRILDIFLQILEDGRLTDSKGETVYFSDTIIIFTSNLGASEVLPSPDKQKTAEQFIDIVKNYFNNELKRPELLGRIGYNAIVPFNFIQGQDFMYRIAKSKMKPIQKALEEKFRLSLTFEEEIECLNYILKFVDPTKGGRDILNALNDQLLTPLSMFLFENKEDLRSMRGSSVVVSLKPGKGFDFEFDE